MICYLFPFQKPLPIQLIGLLFLDKWNILSVLREKNACSRSVFKCFALNIKIAYIASQLLLSPAESQSIVFISASEEV